MKKIQTIILILILSGCWEEPKFLKNEFTKKVNRVTETSIKIAFDTLNNKILDTISITDKFYNDNNQIVRKIQNTLFDDEIMEIDFIYNKSKVLQKEIVKLSIDTIVVHYFYKDTLLFKTSSKTDNLEYGFEQITNHRYTQNNKLKEVLTSQIFVDKESGDTALNTLIVDKYNGLEELKENQTINLTNPENSNKILYNYKNGKLLNTKNYNEKDSLISIIHFEYIYDKFDNWIEKRSEENKKLKYIRKRNIEYK